MFVLGKKSLDNLKGVHPDLVSVVMGAIAITPIDFTVGEGLRTVERQKELLASGKSTTMKSRHLTGHAVDLWALKEGKVDWLWAPYEEIAKAMKKAASDLYIKIEWGGDWKSFKDGPHFQLPFKEYP